MLSLFRGYPKIVRPPSKSKTISGVSPPPSSYSTTFSLTQNPIVEDGWWLNGAADALDWSNVQTSGGRSFATNFAAGVDDSAAIRQGINSTRHFAEATVYIEVGYNPTNGHELELLGGATATAHVFSTYEHLFSLSGSFQIVRWNGAYNDLNLGLTVNTFNGGPALPSNGMVCRIQYSIVGGNPFTEVFQNGTKVADMTDSSAGKLTSGQPGLSHFVRAGSGASLTGMGWEDFSCGTF